MSATATTEATVEVQETALCADTLKQCQRKQAERTNPYDDEKGFCIVSMSCLSEGIVSDHAQDDIGRNWYMPPNTLSSNSVKAKQRKDSPRWQYTSRRKLNMTERTKSLSKITGPPAPLAIALICLVTVYLSCRSNQLALQALLEAKKQTALAEWSAALEFRQYCESRTNHLNNTAGIDPALLNACAVAIKKSLSTPPSSKLENVAMYDECEVCAASSSGVQSEEALDDAWQAEYDEGDGLTEGYSKALPASGLRSVGDRVSRTVSAPETEETPRLSSFLDGLRYNLYDFVEGKGMFGPHHLMTAIVCVLTALLLYRIGQNQDGAEGVVVL